MSKFELLVLMLVFGLAGCARSARSDGNAFAGTACGERQVVNYAQSDDSQLERPPGMWSADDELLSSYRWELQGAVSRSGRRIDALFVFPKRPLELTFKKGWFGVLNSCNGIGGSYRILNGRLAIGIMTSTLSACHEPKIANLDEEIRDRLSDQPCVQLQRKAQPRLRLMTDAGDILDFFGTTAVETNGAHP